MKLIFKRTITPDYYNPCNDDECIKFENPSRKIDIEATYNALIEIGGCSDQQARSQTAYYIKRYQDYLANKWTTVAVTLNAQEEVKSKLNPKYKGVILLSYTSLGGIETDTTPEHWQEVNLNLAHELIHTLDITTLYTPEQVLQEVVDDKDNVYMNLNPETIPIPIPPKPKIELPNQHFEWEYDRYNRPVLSLICYNCGSTYDGDDKDTIAYILSHNGLCCENC